MPCRLTMENIRVKVKATGEILDGRMWEETRHFKAWPPDERVWSEDEIERLG